MAQRIAAAALLLITLAQAACSGTVSVATPQPVAVATAEPAPSVAAASGAAASCSIPPKTYADLAACKGKSKEIKLDLAKDANGHTVARIVVASKKPKAILAAMGAYTAKWSQKADSFTVFAYGSRKDYRNGAGYNRGRIYWNDGGPIEVKICTDWYKFEVPDACSEESTYIVENR